MLATPLYSVASPLTSHCSFGYEELYDGKLNMNGNRVCSRPHEKRRLRKTVNSRKEACYGLVWARMNISVNCPRVSDTTNLLFRTSVNQRDRVHSSCYVSTATKPPFPISALKTGFLEVNHEKCT